ncbi:hypothetical protein QQS21_001656 [Conoideocrella luteorostrata]|uniref:Peptidase M43 pregnancy-associated plasma-A domain-containing protein n=1 Tax=Conoideocrella luteorostrata TaxID=1105319 RepID=A0AAJ0CWQ3_9HYPO|nr:hypothetical protein QQS21_001656 [Conoideocrella luteorostrata]
MRSLFFPLLISFALLVAAKSSPDKLPDSGYCGVKNISKEWLAAIHAAAAKEPKLVRRNATNFDPAIKINVYAHVIGASEQFINEHYKNETIEDQMKLLNKAYLPGNIQFNLVNISTSIQKHFTEGYYHGRMSHRYRKGDNRDLNIYFLHKSTYLGTPELAYNVSPWNKDYASYFVDRVVLSLKGTLRESSIIHEVGHWFGLLHTWGEGEASCTGDGDLVDDTPAHLSSSGQCPLDKPLDTCPDQKGLDPVHNFMNYVPKSCYDGYWENGFTTGQFVRMRQMWKDLRSESLPRPNWPSQLERIPSKDLGGELPYYGPPSNPELAYLRCFLSDNGTASEEPEEYCGTGLFCANDSQRSESFGSYSRYIQCSKRRGFDPTKKG